MSTDCSVHGAATLVDGGKSGKIWAGIFAAICSALCTGLMGVDVVRSTILWKKPWIGCKYFPFNAMTIGLLGYATLICVDSREPMPGFFDQLVKVSGITFLVFAINHAMPSLGVMDMNDIITTLIALGGLVFTTIYSIWIQIGNRLIQTYDLSVRVLTIALAFIYLLLVSTSVTVPTIKKHLESQYISKHDILKNEIDNDNLTDEELDAYIKKYWFMAFTSSPDYALRASGTSFMVGGICWGVFCHLVVTIGFLNDIVRRRCYSKSHYKTTVIVIIFFHVIAISYCICLESIWYDA